MRQYFIYIENKQNGPFSFEDLKEMELLEEMYVWYDGLEDWTEIQKVDELKDFIKKVKTPPPFIGKKTPPPFISQTSILTKNEHSQKETNDDFNKAINKNVRTIIILFIVSLSISLFTTICYINLVTGSEEKTVNSIGSFGNLIYLAGIIMFLRLLYKGWSIIPESSSRTTPSKAVGFLFIPLFNFYWAFISFYGWCVDINKYINQTNSSNKKHISETVGMITPIAMILYFISGLVYLIVYANASYQEYNSYYNEWYTRHDGTSIMIAGIPFVIFMAFNTFAFILFSLNLAKGLKLINRK